MRKMRLYNVIGIDDLEGDVFSVCTTLEKAVIAKKILEDGGLEGCIDIVQDKIPVDTIEINGKLIDL